MCGTQRGPSTVIMTSSFRRCNQSRWSSAGALNGPQCSVVFRRFISVLVCVLTVSADMWGKKKNPSCE